MRLENIKLLLQQNKVSNPSELPCAQGIYIVCIVKKGIEQFMYIGSSKNLNGRFADRTHPYHNLKKEGENPYILYAILGSNFRKIEMQFVAFYKPCKNRIPKDKTGLIIRNVELNTEDISTIASFALTTQNISFKKYVEKLLSEKASQIRKKQIA